MSFRKETLAEGVELYLGDAREIVPTLQGIDAVVSDPPYGISHRRGSAGNRGKGVSLGTKGIANDSEPFDPAALLGWPCLLWGANYYAGALPKGRWLVWDKVCGGGAGDFSEAEIAWCSTPGATKVFRHMWMGVQRDSQVGEKRLHPTEKPIALLAWCLTFFPNANHILDPYMGSGPAGIACLLDGRKFTGIEIDPAHFDTACYRLPAELRQPSMFVSPPEPAKQLTMLDAEA